MKKKIARKKVSTGKWKKIRIGRASNMIGAFDISTKELSLVSKWMEKSDRALFSLAIREMIHVAAASRRLVKK